MGKPKKCKACKLSYIPTRPLQIACGYICAILLVKLKTDKKARKDLAEGRIALKSRSEWLKDAQTWVNKFVRLRDAGLPCISCQRYHTGQLHAGHYRSVGAAPELRYNDEFNIHLQCQPCNTHLSGNLLEYRINLVRKIGQDKVDWLEGKHEPRKYTIPELQALIVVYKSKCKELTIP